MRILAGRPAEEVSLCTDREENYTATQRFVGESINTVTEKPNIANYLLPDKDSLVIKFGEMNPEQHSLSAFKLHESFVLDECDVVRSNSKLEIKLSPTSKIGSTFVIWVHQSKLQECEGHVLISLKNTNVTFEPLDYRGCYMSWELLCIHKELNGWRVQQGTRKLLASRSGIERSYGIF